MAVSSASHQGGFSEEPLWYSPEEMNNAWPSVENPDSQGGCAIDKISILIEKPERAKVFAALALNLFVFDNKRQASRDRFDCPFHCKNHFPDAQILMQHVLECPHFSTDKVYCNCCDKYHCFSDYGLNGHFCGDDDNVGSSNEKPRKNSTVRKLTHSVTDFFTKSRSASRASSRASEHPASPTSSTFRRASIFAMAPSPGATRKQSVNCPPESSSSPHYVDHSSSVIHEVPGPDVPRITRAELPGSEHCRVTGPSSRRSNTTISELSISTNCAPAPMFVDAQDVTESPTEDLSMDVMLQGLGTAPSQGLAASHARFPSITTSQSILQHQADQSRQSSWELVQPHMFQVGLPLSPPNAQDGSYTQNLCFQPAVQSPSWQPVHTPSRHGSGDSHFSDGSFTLAGSGSPESSVGQAQQPMTYGSMASMVVTSPTFGVQLERGDEFKCPLCGYRPNGKPSGWRTNFNKHLRNHNSDRIPCPDCKKPLKRIDNVRHHQRHACPKRRLFGSAFQRTRRHEEEDMVEYEWVDQRIVHPKRLRQDSRGAW